MSLATLAAVPTAQDELSVLLDLGVLDYAILGTYFVFVLAIGVAVRRSVKSSEDFLHAGRSLPAWIAGLAVISANLGPSRSWGSRPTAPSTAGPRSTTTGSAPSPPWCSSAW